jgi:hypothetical protein
VDQGADVKSLARREAQPLIECDGGDVAREHVQERYDAFLAKCVDEPCHEKRRVTFATMFGAYANGADLDAPVEPFELQKNAANVLKRLGQRQIRTSRRAALKDASSLRPQPLLRRSETR